MGKILAKGSVQDFGLAVRSVKNRVEVVFVLDSGRVPYRVPFLLAEVGHFAADFEVAFDGRRGFLARGAFPVALQFPVSFFAGEDAGPVLRAVNGDEVLGFAAVVSDLVPHLFAAAALHTVAVIVIIVAAQPYGLVPDISSIFAVLVSDGTGGADLAAPLVPGAVRCHPVFGFVGSDPEIVFLPVLHFPDF